MKYDRETTETLQQGRNLEDMIKSDGWGVAYAKLEQLLNDAGSIFGLEAKDEKSMFTEVAARQMAINIVNAWIKDILGTVEQYRAHRPSLQEDKIIND